MLMHRFSHVRSSSLTARVLGRPDDAAVAAEQGFKTVEAYRKQRGGF